jgi:hypothetical protein
MDPGDPDTAAEQILIRAEAGAIESKARDEARRQASAREQEARDELILSQIRRLEAEIRKLRLATLRPRNGFLRIAARDLETNPHMQFRVHRWGLYYWLLNMPAVAILFFFAQALWLKWGVFIILEYSIYANLATDYGAMSAAMAAFEDRFLPPIPGTPFSGGRGGTGGTGGAGGQGGAGQGGEPGHPGESGEIGSPGEPGESGTRPPA